MLKKSRFVLATGLVVAVGASSMALADGVSENTAFVDGKVSPSKLDKKKYKPIKLFSGVRTETTVNGLQKNPTVEYISYPKNVKFDFNAGAVCTTLPPSGSTAQQARDACPADSYLGQGAAEVQGPGIAPITDIVVSVFRGPAKNGILLHTSSTTLGAAAPTVPGSVVKSDAGKEFGQALSVPHAPETGALMITKFNANIDKSSKATLGRCKDKTMTFQRKVTYADGSTETVDLAQKCKRK